MNDKNIEGFKQARFGLFIHWGLYAIPGGRWKGERMEYIGEWLQSKFRIPNAEYAELAQQFNPRYFNAEEWVECAQAAGMAYIVFTAKHHDGFAMYHSRVSPYNIVDATPFGRDVLRELANACKLHGMKLGIYYSHCLDWHESDGADPGPDCDKNFNMSWGNDWDFSEFKQKEFSRYLKTKAFPQIQELLTDYGPVFLLWFDCPIQITRQQCGELRSLVKSLQPDCLISGRIGHGMGDFGNLGDNQMPVGNPGFPLESANTINHTWGYKKDDHQWMDAKSVIAGLLSTNERDVNYLLNVGPRADGRLPEAAVDVLAEVGNWRKRWDVQIQNTAPNPFPQQFPWGWCTTCGRTLQFFIKDAKTELAINGIDGEIESCTLPFEHHDKTLLFSLPKQDDELPVVVKVTFAQKPLIDSLLTLRDGILQLSPVKGKILYGTATAVGSPKQSFGAAAEVLATGGRCSLGNNGALTQWHHAGDGLCWQIRIPEKGLYEIQVTTINRRHSAPWCGLRTVRIEFNGQCIEKKLEPTRMLKESYYHGAVSNIGILEIAAPECGLLTLTTQAVSSQEAIDMELTSVDILSTQNREKQK